MRSGDVAEGTARDLARSQLPAPESLDQLRDRRLKQRELVEQVGQVERDHALVLFGHRERAEARRAQPAETGAQERQAVAPALEQRVGSVDDEPAARAQMPVTLAQR